MPRGDVNFAQAIAIAATYAAGHITRAEAERLMFTDEELRMTPEERRRAGQAPPLQPTALPAVADERVEASYEAEGRSEPIHPSKTRGA